jgi:hypothetical protein
MGLTTLTGRLVGVVRTVFRRAAPAVGFEVLVNLTSRR